MNIKLIAVALAIILLAGWRDGGDPTTTEAVVKEYIAATESLDLERTLSLYSDAIIWEDPGYGKEGDYFVGKTKVESMYQWLYSLPSVEIDDTDYFISVDGTRAAVEWVWSGDNGEETYAIRGLSILEIDGGKIVHEILYYDPTNAP